MNRKGFVADIGFTIVMMFGIAFSLVIAYVLYSEVKTALDNTPEIAQAQKDQLSDIDGRYKNVFDYMFLTLFVGVVISLIVSSFVLRTEPGLFFLVLIVVTVFGAIAGYLSNSFVEATTGNVLGTSLLNFPITSFIMNNYLVLTVGTSLLMVLVFFAKPGGDL